MDSFLFRASGGTSPADPDFRPQPSELRESALVLSHPEGQFLVVRTNRDWKLLAQETPGGRTEDSGTGDEEGLGPLLGSQLGEFHYKLLEGLRHLLAVILGALSRCLINTC